MLYSKKSFAKGKAGYVEATKIFVLKENEVM